MTATFYRVVSTRGEFVSGRHWYVQSVFPGRSDLFPWQRRDKIWQAFNVRKTILAISGDECSSRWTRLLLLLWYRYSTHKEYVTVSLAEIYSPSWSLHYPVVCQDRALTVTLVSHLVNSLNSLADRHNQRVLILSKFGECIELWRYCMPTYAYLRIFSFMFQWATFSGCVMYVFLMRSALTFLHSIYR